MFDPRGPSPAGPPPLSREKGFGQEHQDGGRVQDPADEGRTVRSPVGQECATERPSTGDPDTEATVVARGTRWTRQPAVFVPAVPVTPATSSTAPMRSAGTPASWVRYSVMYVYVVKVPATTSTVAAMSRRKRWTLGREPVAALPLGARPPIRGSMRLASHELGPSCGQGQV